MTEDEEDEGVGPVSEFLINYSNSWLISYFTYYRAEVNIFIYIFIHILSSAECVIITQPTVYVIK